jgi:hypothetical protein
VPEPFQVVSKLNRFIGEEPEMEVLQLLITGDAARRQVERSLRHDGKPAKPEPVLPRRKRARAASAAALRILAERLEPSPT